MFINKFDAKVSVVLGALEKFCTDRGRVRKIPTPLASPPAYHYYYLENGELKVAQAIVFDATVNESAPWFMAYDNDWDTSNDTPIDEATAISITDAHRAAYTAPDYFPYSLY